MLQHCLKIAIRNFRKHKIFSFLNISGLAIGMAGAYLWYTSATASTNPEIAPRHNMSAAIDDTQIRSERI